MGFTHHIGFCILHHTMCNSQSESRRNAKCQLSSQAEKEDSSFLHPFVPIRPSTCGMMAIPIGEGPLLYLVY